MHTLGTNTSYPYSSLTTEKKPPNIFIQSQSPLLEVILSCEPAAAFTSLICWLPFLIKESLK